MKADNALRFINSVVNEFQNGSECGDESFIIPHLKSQNLSYSLIYSTVNWMKFNQNIFWRNFKFTNDSFWMVITWKTRNKWSLFPLKDKNDYKSCVIYKGVCSCGSRYTGETKRNAKVRLNKHNNPTKNSEPSKHLQQQINYCFTWTVISNAPKNAKTRKNKDQWS